MLWSAGFFCFAYTINHYKIDETRSADAIIVLTGGKNRIRDAFALFNKGLAEKMFISGVQKDVSIENILQHNDIELGENNNIELGKSAHTTVENAIETKEWIEENNIKSIYLVTSNYHTPRSMEEFKNLNPNTIIYPAPVFSENVSKRWWTNFGTFKLIMSEYTKYIFVKINHTIYKYMGD